MEAGTGDPALPGRGSPQVAAGGGTREPPLRAEVAKIR